MTEEVSYITLVIGEGSHASLVIPDEVLVKLKTNRRAPLLVTVNGHSYQSTATGVAGECRVVFPQRDRALAGVQAGDVVSVTLQLDGGRREVALEPELRTALDTAGLLVAFESLTYSKRRELARGVSEAKTAETRQRRIAKILGEIGSTEG